MRVAVVLAGGSGTRTGAAVNKVLVPLAGRPALAWSVETLGAVADSLVVVSRPDDIEAVEAFTSELGFDAAVVAGGETRHGSEEMGLRAAAELGAVTDDDVIAIHDGARPLVSAELAERVLAEAERVGGAWPALGAQDLYERDDGGVGPRRDGLLRAQTPQAFRAASLHAAYAAAARAGFEGTDTLETVLGHGDLECVVVEGDPRNLKITFAEDFTAAEALIARAGGHPTDNAG